MKKYLIYLLLLSMLLTLFAGCGASGTTAPEPAQSDAVSEEQPEDAAEPEAPEPAPEASAPEPEADGEEVAEPSEEPEVRAMVC